MADMGLVAALSGLAQGIASGLQERRNRKQRQTEIEAEQKRLERSQAAELLGFLGKGVEGGWVQPETANSMSPDLLRTLGRVLPKEGTGLRDERLAPDFQAPRQGFDLRRALQPQGGVGMKLSPNFSLQAPEPAPEAEYTATGRSLLESLQTGRPVRQDTREMEMRGMAGQFESWRPGATAEADAAIAENQRRAGEVGGLGVNSPAMRNFGRVTVPEQIELPEVKLPMRLFKSDSNKQQKLQAEIDNIRAQTAERQAVEKYQALRGESEKELARLRQAQTTLNIARAKGVGADRMDKILENVLVRNQEAQRIQKSILTSPYAEDGAIEEAQQQLDELENEADELFGVLRGKGGLPERTPQEKRAQDYYSQVLKGELQKLQEQTGGVINPGLQDEAKRRAREKVIKIFNIDPTPAVEEWRDPLGATPAPPNNSTAQRDLAIRQKIVEFLKAGADREYPVTEQNIQAILNNPQVLQQIIGTANGQ